MTPSAATRWLSLALDLALYVALPLVGLLLLGWDWRPIVLLYWLENITIGGVTFISLIRGRIARRAQGAASAKGAPGMHPAFFFVHYGIFTLVHGMFVGVLVMLPLPLDGPAPEPLVTGPLVAVWAAASLVQWVIACVTKAPQSGGVGRAYARVFALHLTIIGGVWLIISLGLPAVVAVVLVGVHAIADVILFSGDRDVKAGRARVTQTGGSSWNFSRVDELP